MTKQHSADLRGEQTVASNQWLIIGASSLGTVFEWYDFYLYGLLASIITAQLVELFPARIRYSAMSLP
jgi:hypothetical protein